MTLPDTLAALSEAATDADRAAAVSMLFPDDSPAWYNSDTDDYALRNRIEMGLEDSHPAVEGFVRHRRNVIIEALRTGQLVPVPSVEVVARIIFSYCGEDDSLQVATAVIAAMKGEAAG